jgi:hypothetical protein
MSNTTRRPLPEPAGSAGTGVAAGLGLVLDLVLGLAAGVAGFLVAVALGVGRVLAGAWVRGAVTSPESWATGPVVGACPLSA